VIGWLHDDASASAAEGEFVKATHGGVPDAIPELAVGKGPHKLAPLLVKSGLAASNGEAMRKMKEGAVKIDGEKVTEVQKEYVFEKAVVLQLGNRKFVRLVIET
jgi:tyrosyl-tRNA synthetase